MTPFTRCLFPLIAMVIGFILDLLFGDPEPMPHLISLIGKLISALEKLLRRLLPKSAAGERTAGGLLLALVALICFGVPFGLLMLCYWLTPILGIAVEALLCWQIFASKSLRDACMKVYRALKRGNPERARKAVSRVVSRDTDALDEAGIIRATVESASKNICDAGIAPIIFTVLGGAPLGLLYRAVNVLDSMVGHVDEPYKNFGLIPARADDVLGFIPARISALLMLLGGFILNLNVSNGFKIFKRDRRNHPGPNPGQTQSVCAGLLGIQLGGNASYNGIVHMRKTIGDPIRRIELDDIKRSCSLVFNTVLISAVLFYGIRLLIAIALIPK